MFAYTNNIPIAMQNLSKPHLTFVLFLFCVANFCQAQDTVFGQYEPMDYYYSNQWPTNEYNDIKIGAYGGVGNGFAIENAKGLFTNDSLKVYGIAAILVTPPDYYNISLVNDYGIDSLANYMNVYDPSYEKLIEYLRLYDYDSTGDSLILVDETPVHIRHTPVSYILDLHHNNFPFDTTYPLWPPMPVYERYFDSAHTMIDSFYVGYTVIHSNSITVDGAYYRSEMWPVVSIDFFSRTWYAEGIHEKIAFHYRNNLQESIWVLGQSNTFIYVFPIITPNPDTTGDTNSMGIVETNPVSRHTSIQPNPATDHTTVLSSFGIVGIEVYNSAGQPVLRQKCNGPKADIDTKGWPADTYIVKIHTSLGECTKKLSVIH